jgi:hypothetical protein
MFVPFVAVWRSDFLVCTPVLQGEVMRGFAIIMVLLVLFGCLIVHFSFWVAFGGLYVAGMIVVALIASFGRRREAVSPVWKESTETDQV